MAAGDGVELIEELIGEEVDVNSTYPEGQNGLIMAVYNGRLPEIRCFLRHNINVNHVTHFGETAMDATDKALRNKEEAVALLEKAGALRRQDICAKCGKTSKDEQPPKMQKCGQCKKIYYCSSDCQRKHWKKHKEHCKKPET